MPPQISDRELFAYLKANADKGESEPPSVTGSIEKAMAAAEIKLSQTYTVAYIAHAPLEPRAAVAEWQGDKLTVWTGTQRPFAVRDELAAAFHLPVAKRSRAGAGHRLRLRWQAHRRGGRRSRALGESRRQAGEAGLDARGRIHLGLLPSGWRDRNQERRRRDGAITAWECHNYNSGPSAIDPPYNIPNKLIQFHPADAPLRQGSYRALAATANHFARESHMDELAHAVGMDPLAFRLKNTSNDRLRAVYEAVAEKAAWGKQKSTRERGFGIAGGIEKGGYVATFAEVEIGRNKTVRIVRVTEAFECGAIVNPNGLRNQIAGAIMMGLGGAMFEAIRFDNGSILNPHFAQYRVPRFRDMPQIEVLLLDRKDLPSAGAGETPIVGIAPAVGNAIFAATGERWRAMPLKPS